MKSIVFVMLMILVFALSGCINTRTVSVTYSNISKGNITTTTAVRRISSTTTSISSKRIHKIQIFDGKFIPSKITISSGDRIEWINKYKDCIINIKGEIDISKTIEKGDSFAWSFYKKGEDMFWISENPESKGTIHVE